MTKLGFIGYDRERKLHIPTKSLKGRFMKIVSPDQLQSLDFSVNRMFAVLQFWADGESYNALNAPKKTHSFLCFSGCDGTYTFPDKSTLSATRGDIVFIPAGARYQLQFFNKQSEISTVLINFELSFDGERIALSDRVMTVAKDPDRIFYKLFYQAAHECAGVNASMIVMKHMFYQILHELEKERVSRINQSAVYAKIAKGIAYLENDNEKECSIPQLAALCGVSENTFRRLFRSYAGTSPAEFRLQNKIARAKRLLDTELFTVSETSDLLGFSDVSYFSRLFKRKTGMSPLKYIEIRKQMEAFSVSD